MKRLRLTGIALVAGALAASTLTGSATAATGLKHGNVTITVQLGGVHDAAHTYRTFRATNVKPGSGVELTADHEVSNSSDFCGTLEVDINPARSRLKIGPSSQVCNFSLVRVTVVSKHLGAARLVKSTLFDTHERDYKRTVTNQPRGAEHVTTIQWTHPDDEWEYTYGEAVFSLDTLAYRGGTKPVITGTPKVGKTLKVKRASTESFRPDPQTRAIQWYRSGKKISGATKSYYKVKKADAGKKITVRVTAKGSKVTSRTLRSKSVKIK